MDVCIKLYLIFHAIYFGLSLYNTLFSNLKTIKLRCYRG